MTYLRVRLLCCLIFSSAYSADRQLLMFIHNQPQLLGDEEGLNVAHQALAAIMQKAAPVLMTENIWQHVVQRKDRFEQGLKSAASVQQAVMNLHHDTNEMIKKHEEDVEVVNRELNYHWYSLNYPLLNQLDGDSVKHLMFDYFCYYIFHYLNGWSVYRLPEGYLLWLVQPQSLKGFCLSGMSSINVSKLSQPMFERQALDVGSVLKKYLCSKNKSIHWSFYLTGHGYHQDGQYAQAGIAGMSLLSFQKLLLCLDQHCFTKLLVYSSCYGAGQHAVIPYQDDDTDLILSYPIILISLTDAPAYVFGFPSGLKLPPYDTQHFLVKKDVGDHGLKTHLLQKFRRFCKQLEIGVSDILLAKLVNPNVQCDSYNCNIIKIENVPLLRKAYGSYFVPLDQSELYCLIKSKAQSIDLKNKRACLLYVKQYFGTIMISAPLPVFVSMIPGWQVHYIKSLQAPYIPFDQLIPALFLSIDDLYDQNIYLFDHVTCTLSLSQISSDMIHDLEQVMVVPAGQWLPSFATDGASCYVYVQYKNNTYAIVFDQNKRISEAQKLEKVQTKTLQRFKQLLLQANEFGKAFSLKELLSSSHYKQMSELQKQLLDQCVQQKICK